MNAFIVELANVPGALAEITEAIAEKGINILGFTGATSGATGSVVFITNDESATRAALAGTGATTREAELVVASLAHEPGTLAKLARQLADAGVNIEAALPTGMEGGKISVAFATDNPERAREIIGEKAAVAPMM